MDNIHYLPKDKGAFVLEEEGKRLAEMIVDITENELSVYHTGVSDQLQGKGIGTKLVEAMSRYAREHNLTVVPYCPFVQAVYKRHPERFAGIQVKNIAKRKT